MNVTIRTLAGCLALAVQASGCVVWIREPAAYREELTELVQQREDVIASCFDDVLERTQLQIEQVERVRQGPYEDIGPAVSTQIRKTSGTVLVRIAVEPRTGIVSARVQPAGTTVQPEVQGCVTENLRGLELSPADRREGRLDLTLAFSVGAARKDRAAQPTGSQHAPEASAPEPLPPDSIPPP